MIQAVNKHGHYTIECYFSIFLCLRDMSIFQILSFLVIYFLILSKFSLPVLLFII